MPKLALLSLFVASLLVSFTAVAAETAPRPLRQTELLALVAGNALPENIVNEIHTRGVAFRLDDSFRAQLATAGATPSVLSALDAAKSSAAAAPEDRPDPALLQHITTAAKLMKDKRYDEAADELTAALKGNFEKFEVGFVMGELLRQQERWAQSAAVYNEVLRQDPDFPEAHTKLSYLMYRLGDPEQILREARIALARTPENAEAHKNAGVGLENLSKLDAAILEYKEALRIKPDYQVVHYDLGLLFYRKHDWDASITEYKKAILLKPEDIQAHYNLGVTFVDKGDIDSAIREYREAKRLDPTWLEARQSLGMAFLRQNMNAEAVQEFRDLEAIAPNDQICHQYLGIALRRTWDLKGAEEEFRKAAKLDPSDPEPLLGLGAIQEDQKHYDAALVEYRKAEELDENSAAAHRCIGRVMLLKKNAPEAVKELEVAVNLSPTDPNMHDLYAQSLLLSGDLNAAIGEFKESLALDAKQTGVRLELANALEKKGDWVAALDQYRKAAVADTIDPTTIRPGVSVQVFGAAQKYSQARERFSKHVEALKSTGKASEAAELENTIHSTQTAVKATEKLDLAMQSGSQAMADKRLDDAERFYKEAVQIAEKLPQPEIRLATALGHLGQISMYRQDFAGAQADFEHQLKITEKVHGLESPATTDPLKWMAFNAIAQQDLATAQKFFDRALAVNRKAYGENSVGYAEVLRTIAGVYTYQRVYEKAEPYLIQAADIAERLYGHGGHNDGLALTNLWALCSLYDTWGKPEKLEPCDRRLIIATEKQYGPDSQFLEPMLTREAKTLRTLERPQEAAQVEQRLKSLQPSAAVNPN